MQVQQDQEVASDQVQGQQEQKMELDQVQGNFKEVKSDQVQGNVEYEDWHRRMWWWLYQVQGQQE